MSVNFVDGLQAADAKYLIHMAAQYVTEGELFDAIASCVERDETAIRNLVRYLEELPEPEGS